MVLQDVEKPSPLEHLSSDTKGHLEILRQSSNQPQPIISSKDVEKAFDDVDFTSGFETQYEQEYRPLKPKVIVPPSQDAKTLWYRDLKTILVVAFLMAIFLFGTIILTKLVFTTNPLYVFAITAIYVILAIIMIVIEVKTIHVR